MFWSVFSLLPVLLISFWLSIGFFDYLPFSLSFYKTFSNLNNFQIHTILKFKYFIRTFFKSGHFLTMNFFKIVNIFKFKIVYIFKFEQL
jgi:hypothetical protein